MEILHMVAGLTGMLLVFVSMLLRRAATVARAAAPRASSLGDCIGGPTRSAYSSTAYT